MAIVGLWSFSCVSVLIRPSAPAQQHVESAYTYTFQLESDFNARLKLKKFGEGNKRSRDEKHITNSKLHETPVVKLEGRNDSDTE